MSELNKQKLPNGRYPVKEIRQAGSPGRFIVILVNDLFIAVASDYNIKNIDFSGSDMYIDNENDEHPASVKIYGQVRFYCKEYTVLLTKGDIVEELI